jgi:hypothetical protein
MQRILSINLLCYCYLEPLNKGKKFNSYYFFLHFFWVKECTSVGANIRGRWGKRGWGGEHANHRCVQVDEAGGPGNNFLGHEISFYGGEILLGQPVRNRLFLISICVSIKNSERC